MKTPAPDRRPLFNLKDFKPSERTLKPTLHIEAPQELDEIEVTVRGKKGVLVGVRMQPKLLKRLDKHRGGKTRPQAIRELLEKHL